jgi:hypothetical protein
MLQVEIFAFVDRLFIYGDVDCLKTQPLPLSPAGARQTKTVTSCGGRTDNGSVPHRTRSRMGRRGLAVGRPRDESDPRLAVCSLLIERNTTEEVGMPTSGFTAAAAAAAAVFVILPSEDIRCREPKMSRGCCPSEQIR